MTIDFNEIELKQAVIQGLRRKLPNQGANTFKVISAHPSKASLLPCISVTQGSGGLDQQTIGDAWDRMVQDPDTEEYFEVEGVYYRQTVEITIWAIHPDDRDDIKRHVRRALVELRREFSSAGDFHQATVTEQGDSQDFEAQAPQDIYMFTFDFGGIAPVTTVTPLGPPVEDVTVSVSYMQAEITPEEDD